MIINIIAAEEKLPGYLIYCKHISCARTVRFRPGGTDHGQKMQGRRRSRIWDKEEDTDREGEQENREIRIREGRR